MVQDLPFAKNGVVEPGRECLYADRLPTSGTAATEDLLRGVMVSVSQYTDRKWKFDTPEDRQYWDKVENLGDNAYIAQLLPTMGVRHGDWIISVIGMKPAGMSDEALWQFVKDMGKLLVARLPRH